MRAEAPFQALRFRWPWRDYQRRVLDGLEDHASDRRFHLIAPPGAGKTSIGIEVARRLGGPDLVLAPTVAIRDQWIDRLRDFTEMGDQTAWPPAWTSTDLNRPGAFTAITYQALWAASETDREARAEDVAPLEDLIRSRGLATVVLDEAHHLRQSWWRVISSAMEETRVYLVSLTATPPYDAPGREWRRYEELCGPVDEEVAAPELVRSGTPAPHQDFLYLVPPGPELARTIQERDALVEAFLTRLEQNAAFAEEVRNHPWITGEPPVVDVLDRPELAAALLAYLRWTDQPHGGGLERVLGLNEGDAPALSRRMWQTLLLEYLFGSTFTARSKETRADLAAELRGKELLWRRELRLDEHRDVFRSLSLSAAKVGACVQVHRAERRVRGAELRQAILTDFIRGEVLSAPPGEIPVELGAAPVFDAISAHRDDPSRIALLTGRIQIVHGSLLEPLSRWAGAVEHSPHPHRPGFVTLKPSPGQSLVLGFTQLLAAGELDTIVGTRSLLGQGWDAPCLNSIVLASSVGSFVSTNQMRGRALRRDPDNPGKVASIWHLAAWLPDSATGVADVALVRDRFRTFTGPSWSGERIESGLDRLELQIPASTLGMESFNEASLARLESLDQVAQQWEALTVDPLARVRPTVSSTPERSVRAFHVRNTRRHLVSLIVRSGAAAVGWRLGGLIGVDSLRGVVWFAAMVAFASAVAVGPDLVRASWSIRASTAVGPCS